MKREKLWNAGTGGLQIKMGLNKWQEIVIEDMQKAESLASIENSNWWSVGLNFDEVNPLTQPPLGSGMNQPEQPDHGESSSYSGLIHKP